MAVALETPVAEAVEPLSEQEASVLAVLLQYSGRVVSRQELARRSGLADRSERRCDAILVQIRRRLGPTSIRTVRSRGWMLTSEAATSAQALVA
jgi:DNA-binding response OmpR family regulator